MKKIITLFFLFSFICSFSSLVAQTKKKDKPIGTKKQTSNPNMPFVYENGYKNFEVVAITNPINDSINCSQLKFNAVLSARYTQKVLFDKFGLWNRAIKFDKFRTNYLIWENVQLFNDSEERYTIIANGVESIEEMYASVIVFDSKNNDCLNSDSKIKLEIIDFSQMELKI